MTFGGQVLYVLRGAGQSYEYIAMCTGWWTVKLYVDSMEGEGDSKRS